MNRTTIRLGALAILTTLGAAGCATTPAGGVPAASTQRASFHDARPRTATPALASAPAIRLGAGDRLGWTLHAHDLIMAALMRDLDEAERVVGPPPPLATP